MQIIKYISAVILFIIGFISFFAVLMLLANPYTAILFIIILVFEELRNLWLMLLIVPARKALKLIE